MDRRAPAMVLRRFLTLQNTAFLLLLLLPLLLCTRFRDPLAAVRSVAGFLIFFLVVRTTDDIKDAARDAHMPDEDRGGRPFARGLISPKEGWALAVLGWIGVVERREKPPFGNNKVVIGRTLTQACHHKLLESEP